MTRITCVMFLALLFGMLPEPCFPALSPERGSARVALQHLLRKLSMYGRGVVHMSFSSETNIDKSVGWLPDAEVVDGWVTESRRIVFIRHGESKWNAIFNKGKGLTRFLCMPFLFLKGLLLEILSMFSCSSVFLDSPLSKQGIEEAGRLQEWVESIYNDKSLQSEMSADGNATKLAWESILHSALRSKVTENPELVIASSNLQRAAETITIALCGHMQRINSSKVHILSSLQEMSRNVDTIALSPRHFAPRLQSAISRMLKACIGGADEFVNDDELSIEALSTKFDVSAHHGNKPIWGSRGGATQRLREFADWSFCGKEEAVIIAGGHSLWFRSFCRAYMPRRLQHAAKHRKLSNAGVVAFTLRRAVIAGRPVYRVDEGSFQVLYGGYH